MDAKALVALILLAILALPLASQVSRAQPVSASCSQALNIAIEDYGYAARAYDLMHYNGTYVSILNSALYNVSLANSSGLSCDQAVKTLSSLRSQGPTLVFEAREGFTIFVLSVSLSAIALALAAFALDRWGRGLAWSLWLRSHARYTVRLAGAGGEGNLSRAGEIRKHGRDPDSYVTYAVGLLILLAIGLVGTLLFQLYWRPGPYSVLALLNPQHELGDYPQVLLPGTNITLYSYIVNHMNRLELYELRVYVTYANVTPLGAINRHLYVTYYYVVSPSGSNITVPITLRAPSSVGSYKLVVLLYNYTGKGFTYMNLFNQLYFNVSR